MAEECGSQGASSKRERWKKQLQKVKEQLEALYEMQMALLDPESVQSYGIGSRNLSRYQHNPKELQELIDQLEQKEDELEGKLCGRKARKAFLMLPRDY